MSRKFSVVTTFNTVGYEQYGKRMIHTFLHNWPAEVNLIVYAEDCKVEESAPNLTVLDLHRDSVELVAFKNTWKNVPRANGDISADPVRSKRKDADKRFKWDAVRFAHKVYAIFAAVHVSTDWLIWMDADTVCHSPITVEHISQLCPSAKDICFLGRKGKYTECGLYAMNLRSPATLQFLSEFQRVYDNAEQGIFTLAEWHDSFVFDSVRKSVTLNELDWSSHLIQGEGHPLINSEWGAYLDHLKGNRKAQGRSKNKDLLVARTETYWTKKIL
jgi:hypothetical protein